MTVFNFTADGTSDQKVIRKQGWFIYQAEFDATCYFQGTFDGASVDLELLPHPNGNWISVYNSTLEEVKRLAFKAYAYRIAVSGSGANTDLEITIL
ncbi:MAG: hypothetical protein ABEI54_03110 [Candidatus Bipolaricaulia bacterium]